MWLVCQIGAREHYGIARGLQRAGQLGALVTDFWVPPGSPMGRMPGAQRLTDRFDPDLAGAPVHAPNLRMLGFELLARLRKRHGWERMMARNALFQREALKFLADLSEPSEAPPAPRPPTPAPRLPAPDSRLPTPDSRLPTPDPRPPTPDPRLPTPDSRLQSLPHPPTLKPRHQQTIVSLLQVIQVP